MGRIQATIPDELEETLRKAMAKRYGWRKGVLRDVVTLALNNWLSGIETVNTLEKILTELEGKGVIDKNFAKEVLRQKEIFERDRETLEDRYKGLVVVVCGGEFFAGETFKEALEAARKRFKDLPYYSESIKRIDYPSVRVKG